MSQSVRQSNLFTAEDWQAIYQSFQDVDFRAYDFDTLRSALIDYIRTHFPEDYNDYIESSEFIAVVELLCYLGMSLNFRTDLNSRENFLDTAERRESIVRLARMLSYVPKRNLAASGLFKLSGVQTNQAITDSLGRDLNGRTIFWNDPNNVDSFEQFTTILNAAFNSRNPFGRPSKSGTIGSISTDLYQFNNVENVAVTYNLSINVRGEQVPFDVVNPDFNDGEYFFERQPDPNEKFNLIYRNDGEGLGSANSGFFLLFKQGQLQRQDFRFDFPIRNRTTDININNINETDVYFQEINENGAIQNEWTKVPSLVGNNVIFNSIDNQVRNIFNVIPRLNDQVTLKFADGNFGNVPVGIYRTWYRTSINKKLAIRPEDVQNLEINIPYFGADGQEYNLRLLFSLEQTIANGSASETNEEIKQRAPQVFYTQNRMVNGEDYNVFPLTRGNEIQKLKSLNRTHAGHSRYIDINDPTGTSQNLIVFGDDGALYQDDEQARIEVDATLDAATITNVNLQNFIADSPTLLNFFYSDYRTNYLALNGSNAFNITNYVDFGSTPVYWEAQPKSGVNDTGFFKDALTGAVVPVDLTNTFLTEGAQVRFNDTLVSPTDEQWVVTQSITANGIPSDPDAVADLGPIEMTDQVIDEWVAIDLIPNFRTEFTSAEAALIEARISAQADFGIGYNVAANNKAGGWFITPTVPSGEETFTTNTSAAGSWLIFCSYDPVDDVWSFFTRGKRYIFESLEDVRFFFDPQELAVNVASGRSLRDQLQILGTNTATSVPADGALVTPINLTLSELFTYEDGYNDPRKVTVTGVDSNGDGIPDDPLAIDTYLANGIRSDEDIYFERFTDFDDYEYFQLWEHGKYVLGGGPLTITASGTNWSLTGGTGSQLITDVDLITTTLDPTIDANFKDKIDGVDTRVIAFAGTIIYYSSTDTFYEVEQATDDTIRIVETQNYLHRTGRTFQLDSNSTENPLYFKWTHYAPRANRIDPSVSNIIDLILLTTSYYDEIITWKNSNDNTAPVPDAPTTEDLRIQFSELNDYKMLSDQIIFKPGRFKLLFGVGAEDELRATFKVVKVPTTTATDNEVRSEIINAIDDYFDVGNWDFGERFFYTELSAYIHQRLANIVASVVIVPSKADSVFGNLFQVKGESDELFLSTASVADVQIVRNLTDTNLRINN